MKADNLKISRVFMSGGDIHYALPHFQRQYSWEKSNWQTLLDDAIAVYEEYQPDKQPEHFLGSLVVISDGTRNGVITAFKLVDGQQRLTTISLLLCALRDLIKSSDAKTEKAIQKLLINSEEEGDVHFKVLPTTKYGDRQAYTDVLTGKSPSKTESLIPQAYEFLRKELSKRLNSGEILAEQFFIALSNCFQVVFIELSKDESPYKIFESLNAKGKPLSQADLVRNYIAMKLPTVKQEKVFTEYWGKIESLLQESRTVGKSRIGELTAFIRHYLAMQSRVLCSEEHIYARFRDRCENSSNDDEFIKELETLRRFAEYYNKLLRPENEGNAEIRKVLIRLNILEIQTAYPFLLMAYEAHDNRWLSLDKFVDLLSILENYVVRRYICGEPSNYLNKMFPTLWRDVIDEMDDGGLSYEMSGTQGIGLGDALRKVIVTKSYPPDRKIEQSVRSAKLYDNRNQEKICLILETINRYLSDGTGGHTVLNSKATIEHILPQKLTDDWKTHLGEGFERIFQDYLHTLGNLTLVTQAWNSALSNSPFHTKKEQLQKHALCLNKDYFSEDINCWNEQAIIERADFLAQKILEIWVSLGEPPPVTQVSYGKPNAIIIRDDKIDIPNKTWRQLRIVTMEWILKNYPQEFDKIRQIVTIFADSIEGKTYPRDWYRLSNGVWIYHSSSAKQHMIYCRRLLATVGVTESEWNVEEYDPDQLFHNLLPDMNDLLSDSGD